MTDAALADPSAEARPTGITPRAEPSASVLPPWLRDGLLPLLILLAPLALVALSFWPGHMSADTLTQVEQARTGSYTNQHAPLLIALWHPFFERGAGPGWVLTAQLLTFSLGCFLVLRAVFRPLGAALVTAALCLFPPVFGMLGYVGRDTWFTALLVLTFGLTVRAAQRRGRRRIAFAAVAVAAAWLTLAARQNAAAAVVVALAMLAGVLLGAWADRRPAFPALVASHRRRIVVAAAIGVVATVALMGTQVLAQRALQVADVNPEQYLYIYDLAALSEDDRENQFPAAIMPERGMAPVDRYWNVDSVNGYLFTADAPIATPLPDRLVGRLRDAWLDAIRENPLDYLDERGTLMLRQLALTRRAMWTYHPQIDPNPWGYAVKFPELNRRAKEYVQHFADAALDGGILYRVWFYALLALAGAVVLMRRSRGATVACAGALGLGAITYQAGLFFGAMGTQYRFQLPLVVAGLLCAAMLLRLAAARLRATRLR